MDGNTASLIFYSGLLIYGLVLFAFKRLYLDTLESRVLSYTLGLVLAYGILAGVFWQAGKAWLSGLFYRKRYGAAAPILIGVPDFFWLLCLPCIPFFFSALLKKVGKMRLGKKK